MHFSFLPSESFGPFELSSFLNFNFGSLMDPCGAPGKFSFLFSFTPVFPGPLERFLSFASPGTSENFLFSTLGLGASRTISPAFEHSACYVKALCLLNFFPISRNLGAPIALFSFTLQAKAPQV